MALPDPKVDSDALALECLASVDSLLAAEQPAEAVITVRNCQEGYADNPHWNYQFDQRLGIALLRSGEAELALPLLEAWVSLLPGQAQGHRNLGACLVAMGRRGRALSEFQQAVELEPRNAMARLEYGQALLDFRIYKDAGQELLMAAGLCGNCPEVQPPLAQYYQSVHQPAKAANHWQIVWDNTGNPVARRNLLVNLLASGQDSGVLEFLLQQPVRDLPLEELQQLAAAEGRLGQSEQSFLFASLLPEGSNGEPLPGRVMTDATFWGQVSLNLLMAEYYAEALITLDHAISLSPNQVVYLNNRVVLLQRLDRYEEADRQWEEVLLLDPSLKGKQDR